MFGFAGSIDRSMELALKTTTVDEASIDRSQDDVWKLVSENRFLCISLLFLPLHDGLLVYRALVRAIFTSNKQEFNGFFMPLCSTPVPMTTVLSNSGCQIAPNFSESLWAIIFLAINSIPQIFLGFRFLPWKIMKFNRQHMHMIFKRISKYEVLEFRFSVIKMGHKCFIKWLLQEFKFFCVKTYLSKIMSALSDSDKNSWTWK